MVYTSYCIIIQSGIYGLIMTVYSAILWLDCDGVQPLASSDAPVLTREGGAPGPVAHVVSFYPFCDKKLILRRHDLVKYTSLNPTGVGGCFFINVWTGNLYRKTG